MLFLFPEKKYESLLKDMAIHTFSFAPYFELGTHYFPQMVFK